MADNELTLSARVRELETQTAEHKGQMAQLNQFVAQGNRLTIWQFIGFTLVMAGTLFGTLAWISGSLREELNQTSDQLHREIEQTRDQLKGQIEKSEQNMNNRFEDMKARFEDLRQVVLSQQKQPPPKRRANTSATSFRARRQGERRTHARSAAIE